MSFLNNLGGKGIAKMAGEKAGDFVEQTVSNIMDKKDKAGGEGGEAKAQGEDKSGFDISNVVSLGDKKEEKGGLDIGNALGMLGGDKDKDSGGGLSGALGKLF
ncbi:unnamed protein product [Knipowitschia caucasica]|uniref:Uncharacterized protein n=1 Tax=Knipowitschia caucasica TaxID=637954 RepID=A0AAV2JJS1_KNICA